MVVLVARGDVAVVPDLGIGALERRAGHGDVVDPMPPRHPRGPGVGCALSRVSLVGLGQAE
eukprot:2493781-Lingulodinium_polyedra.AAC.1